MHRIFLRDGFGSRAQTLVNSRGLGPWAQKKRHRAKKKHHRAKKNAIGLKKLSPPLLEVRFLEKIELVSTETLYTILVYILICRPSH